jgi:hypothetical protein
LFAVAGYHDGAAAFCRRHGEASLPGCAGMADLAGRRST